MVKCPLCDQKNIEGVDLCERCGQPLDESHLPVAVTAVERGLIVDSVATLAPRSPITVPPDLPIQESLQKLVQCRIGCLFVVEDGKPIGVFSEYDALLRLNTRSQELRNHPISEFMTPNPQSLKETDKIAFAVHRMDVGGCRHLPIVDDNGCILGVISVRDILRYLTEKMHRSRSGARR
jgi:CBS domain-containing protein